MKVKRTKIRKMIIDPIITWIWARCFVIKTVGLRAYKRGRKAIRKISNKTAPVKIPEFVLKDKSNDNIIELKLRRLA